MSCKYNSILTVMKESSMFRTYPSSTMAPPPLLTIFKYFGLHPGLWKPLQAFEHIGCRLLASLFELTYYQWAYFNFKNYMSQPWHRNCNISKYVLEA